MKHKFNFEFSPNLILLLGDQLIHDKKIALSELVKNAYDADASQVEIAITKDQITITDDGCGMDLETIQNIWLKPGVSKKGEDVDQNRLTPKFKRMPIGEKGIGRLCCHKLGRTIELWTKVSGQSEIYLVMDWEKLSKTKKLADLPIDVTQHDQGQAILGGSGTKLVIENLKDEWSKIDFERLSNELVSILDPFGSDKKFTIKLKKGEDLFENDLLEKIKAIRSNALFTFDISVNDGMITKFKYRFSPWLGLQKVASRKVNLENDLDFLRKIIGKKEPETLSFEKKLASYKDLRIGEIDFSGFIYDFDNLLWQKQRQLSGQQKNLTKGYLKTFGGIRVYRDGFRVFNYGEFGSDILDLDLKRVNRHAGKISSNQILAAIKLDRKNSQGLIEKTNREGFINNIALTSLTNILEEIITILNYLRQADKARITRTYLDKATDRAHVGEKITSIKVIIEDSNLSARDKNNLKKILDDFAKEFMEMKDIFLTASNAGLNLTFIVHELDKILGHMEETLKAKDLSRIEVIFLHLKNTLNAYKDVIRLDKRESVYQVTAIIEQAIFNLQYRFDYHKVELIRDIDTALEITCKKNLVVGIFNNLFDNAIYWLDYQSIAPKKICIKAYKQDKETHILVADNGKGFTIDFESALMPFITGRKDESSMGIGLHLADQIMQAHERAASCRNF